MNDLNDAQDWRDVAQHLVEAHGADSGGLTGYAPTLEQLRFAHADTHIALASIGSLPPGGATGGLSPTARSRRHLLPGGIRFSGFTGSSRCLPTPDCRTPAAIPRAKQT